MAWFDDLDLPGSTITGHFAFVTADGPDEDDFPDVMLASGTVRFEPTAKAVRAGGAWVGIAPVTAQVFDGELVVSEEDPRPVRILSTDADTGVDGWGWTATFSIDDADLKPIRFRAPTEGVHLTGDDLIPITGQPVEVIEGADGASVVGGRDNGDGTVSFELSDGTYTDPVTVPPGPRGEPGPKGDKGDKGDPGEGGIEGAIPIFATLAEAQAWEAENPGRVALTLEEQEPDTVPPSSAGILTVSPGDVYADLSVAGASDDQGIAGYAFRVNAGAWSAWQPEPEYKATGLTPSTSYTFQHKVRDASLNGLEGVAVTAETTAEPPLQPGDVITSDSFAGDGTGARTTDALSGGTPMPWAGTVTTAGGRMTLANNGTHAHFAATLPFTRADLAVQAVIHANPTSATASIQLKEGGGKKLSLEWDQNGNMRLYDQATTMFHNTVPRSNGDLIRAEVVGADVTVTNVTTSQSVTITQTIVGAGGTGVMLRNGAAIDDLVVEAL